MSITRYPATTPTGPVAVDRQAFAAAGTWTKPTGAQLVRVQLLSGGGGGQGGGSTALSNALQGGNGGAAGTYIEAWYQASDLPSTVAVAIGTGGAGGAGATGSTGGTPGATGGVSTFGTYLLAASQNRAPGQLNDGDGSNSAQGGQSAFGASVSGLTEDISDVGFGASPASGSTLAALPARNDGMTNQPLGGAGGGSLAGSSGLAAPAGPGFNNLAMVDDGNVQVPATHGSGGNYTPVAVVKSLADTAYGCIPYYSGCGGAAGGATGGTGGPGGSAQGYGAGGGGGGASRTVTGVGGTGGRGAPGLAIVTSY